MGYTVYNLPALTSARFFAAAAIVFFHFSGYLWRPADINPAWALGVSFYFVLSGFILTYNYGERRGSWAKTYYRSRFARIWPIHAVTFGLALVAFPSVRQFLTDPLVLVANLGLLHSWTAKPVFVYSFNGVSWSLATEAFFYAVFPLLCLLRRLDLVFVALLAITVALVFAAGQLLPISPDPWVSSSSTFVQHHPLARLPEFVLGMVAAQVFRNVTIANRSLARWTVFELLAVGAVLLFGWCTAPFRPWMADMYASSVMLWFSQSGGMLFFGTLIFVLAQGAGMISRLLSYRTFVLLGEISFATFMVHVAMIHLTLNHQMPVLFALPLIYLVAYLLWRFIEKPARRFLAGARFPVQQDEIRAQPSAPAG